MLKIYVQTFDLNYALLLKHNISKHKFNYASLITFNYKKIDIHPAYEHKLNLSPIPRLPPLSEKRSELSDEFSKRQS